MTWEELAILVAEEEGYHDVAPQEAGWALWNATCFPFGTQDQVTAQLRDYYNGVEFDYFGGIY